MLVVKNVYRSAFLLFTLLCAPSYMYSDNSVQSFQELNTGTEVIKSELLNRKITRAKNSFCKLNKKQHKIPKKLSYYIYIDDFIQSFIEIPSSNVLDDSSTLSSRYLAGRAAVYNKKNIKAGTCSASFLCMQNEDGIYTDIANYLSVDNGLVVSWFTPTTLINLELDNILNSMVTECIVVASTKVGVNPFYGETFNMVVSSDGEKIHFKLKHISD